jgi:Xaa-Pro aminopeptidase
MDATAQSLLAAQHKAAALFDEVVSSGLIQAGKLESELSMDIHRLAKTRFDLRRHWHKRIVRSGPNTLLGYYDEAPDRRVQDDDIVYLDFGPVFAAWEADFGRSYALGADPDKHRLIADIDTAFHRGKALYRNSPGLSCGDLYDYVAGLATEAGWEFGAATAGHLIGEFPHERAPSDPKRFSIRSGNRQSLREPDEQGRPRHWILEIHFVDRERQIGAFCEELLTIDPEPSAHA